MFISPEILSLADLGMVNGNFIHYQKFKTKWQTPTLDPDLPLFKMAADRYREMYGENWKGANFRSEVANTTFQKSGPTVHLASDILLLKAMLSAKDGDQNKLETENVTFHQK